MNRPAVEPPHARTTMQLSLPFPPPQPREEKAGAPPAAQRVFTIPPSAPFLPTLTRALRDGRLLAGFPPRPPHFLAAPIFLPTHPASPLAPDPTLPVPPLD